MLDEVTTSMERHQGRSDLDYARMLTAVASAQTKAGRKGEAVGTFELLRDLQERLCGTRHPEVASILTQLGALYSQLADHEKAYEYLDRALDIRQEQFGADSQEAGLSLSYLAGALARDGRWPEALDAAERGVGILRSKGAPEYPHALETLSRIHESRGRLAEAETLRAKACHLIEDVAGAKNAWLAQWLEDRAALLRRMERNTEATLLEQRAAGIWEAIR
jgi:tetratricopeptide (TPR) repeat protein